MEEKPARNTEFPLDHILPVFNLNNKKESSFIPTFKAKQKDSGVANKDKFNQLNGLKLKGVFNGNAIQHKHTSKTSGTVSDSLSVSLATPLQDQTLPITEQASSLATPAIEIGVISNIQAPTGVIIGSHPALKERKFSHGAGPDILSTASEHQQMQPATIRNSPAPPTRFTSHTIQPSTDMPIMESFSRHVMLHQQTDDTNLNSRPQPSARKTSQVTQQVTSINNHSTLEPILRRSPINPIQSSKQIVKQTIMPQNQQEDALQKQYQSPLQFQESNVIKIGLDISAPSQKSRSIAYHSAQKESNSRFGEFSMKMGQSNSIQRNRDQHVHNTYTNGAQSQVVNSVPQRTSSKIQAIYDNVAGGLHNQQAHQRSIPYQRTSKLNELFGDVNTHYYKPKHQQAYEASQTSSAALKYMENLLGQQHSKIAQQQKQLNQNNQSTPQVGSSELIKSVKVDRSAILPEISSQHKNKEQRAMSNKSHMNPIMPQEFTGLSNYHQGKVGHGHHPFPANVGAQKQQIHQLHQLRRPSGSSPAAAESLSISGIGKSGNLALSPPSSKNYNSRQNTQHTASQPPSSIHIRAAAAFNGLSNKVSDEDTSPNIESSMDPSFIRRHFGSQQNSQPNHKQVYSQQKTKNLFQQYVQAESTIKNNGDEERSGNPFLPQSAGEGGQISPPQSSSANHKTHQLDIFTGTVVGLQRNQPDNGGGLGDASQANQSAGIINLGTQDNANAYFALFKH